MNDLTFLRSPLLRLGAIGVVLALAYYAGMRVERGRQTIAAAEARAAFAERETALAVESERRRGAAMAAETRAAAAAVVAADAERRASEAASQASRTAADLAAARRARRTVETTPGVTTEDRLAAADAEAAACAEAFGDEQRAYRETFAALTSEQAAHAETRKVVMTLRNAMAATHEEMANVRLQFEAADTGRRMAESRSKRRGTVIAISFAAGALAAQAINR